MMTQQQEPRHLPGAKPGQHGLVSGDALVLSPTAHMNTSEEFVIPWSRIF